MGANAETLLGKEQSVPTLIDFAIWEFDGSDWKPGDFTKIHLPPFVKKFAPFFWNILDNHYSWKHTRVLLAIRDPYGLKDERIEKYIQEGPTEKSTAAFYIAFQFQSDNIPRKFLSPRVNYKETVLGIWRPRGYIDSVDKNGSVSLSTAITFDPQADIFFKIENDVPFQFESITVSGEPLPAETTFHMHKLVDNSSVWVTIKLSHSLGEQFAEFERVKEELARLQSLEPASKEAFFSLNP